MSNLKCSPGKISNVSTLQPDCSCVGIESIDQSSDLTRIYINLTNGVTDTFVLPSGTPGPEGPAGPAGEDGSNLIHSGPVVSGAIASKLTTISGSYQTLDSFATDHTADAENLVNVGDIIRVHAVYKLTANPAVNVVNVQLLINGTGLANLTLSTCGTVNASNREFELFCDIVMQSDAAGANTLRIDTRWHVWNLLGLGVLTSFQERKMEVFDIGGATVDFANLDYTISAQALSDTVGDVSLELFTAEKLSSI